MIFDFIQTLQQRILRLNKNLLCHHATFYLEFLFNPVAASAVEQSHLRVTPVLMRPQMLPDSGRVKCRDQARVPAAGGRAHGAVQGDGVDDVVVVG